MNTLLVIALAVGAVSADIGLTYNNYQVPQTSYGVPSYQYSGTGDYNTGYTGATGYNYKAQTSAQAGYQGSKFGQQNTGYQTGYPTNNIGEGSSTNGFQTINGGYPTSNNQVSSSSGLSSLLQPTYQYNGGASSQAGYQNYNQYQTQYQNQYQTSAVQKYQESYNQYQQQPAQVFKHFYVHAAPEEPEVPKIRQPVVLPPPQKHYKIIFIKTPTQTVYAPQYVPVPQQNEEKTIVYVLVKKPEDQGQIVVPKVEQKPPTKPEVFFIKYNNKADSQAVINNIVNDYNKGGSSNFATGAAAQGTGQYSSGTGTTGQYSSGSGQSQGSNGQYSQGAYGQYAQGTQSDTQSSTADYGSQSYGGSSAQTLSVASADASTAGGGYGSSDTTGYSSTGSATSAGANLNYGSLDSISTSQGIPHETYGPPKFRV